MKYNEVCEIHRYFHCPSSGGAVHSDRTESNDLWIYETHGFTAGPEVIMPGTGNESLG